MLPEALEGPLLMGPGADGTGAFTDPFGTGKIAGGGLEHVAPDDAAPFIDVGDDFNDGLWLRRRQILQVGLEATGYALHRLKDHQLLAHRFRQGEGANSRILVLPEPQEVMLLGIHPALLTLPAAKHIKGFVIGGPAIGGFVDAAGERNPIAVGVFDHTLFGVKDGAIAADLPLLHWQADADLKVTLVHQPGQEFGSQVSATAIPGLHIPKRELTAELLFEQLFWALFAAKGLQIRTTHEEARDQAHLAVVAAIRRGQHQLLHPIEHLKQGAAGEIAGDAPVAHRIHEGWLVEALQQALQGAAEAPLPGVITQLGHGAPPSIRRSTSSNRACTTVSQCWRLRSRGSGSSS